MEYKIYEENMERLEKKLNRIGNKCRKYGCPFSFKKTGETFETVKRGQKEVTLKYIVVEVEGNAILNNWEFAASIDTTENGNIFKKSPCFIGEIPERYYNSDPVCEHCGNKRVRHTFIVHNKETDEYKQVGRSCLADFTCGMSAESAAQYVSIFDELIKGNVPDGCEGHRSYIDTKEFLCYCAECIRAYGYRRKSDPEPTSEKAVEFYGCNHGWYSFMESYKKKVESRDGKGAF